MPSTSSWRSSSISSVLCSRRPRIGARLEVISVGTLHPGRRPFSVSVHVPVPDVSRNLQDRGLDLAPRCCFHQTLFISCTANRAQELWTLKVQLDCIGCGRNETNRLTCARKRCRIGMIISKSPPSFIASTSRGETVAYTYVMIAYFLLR